jgi:prefoldin subunit 5
MTEREIEIINQSIAAYQRMIDYFQKQINSLEAKKIEPCCFEDKMKVRLKIGGINAKATKRYFSKRQTKDRSS